VGVRFAVRTGVLLLATGALAALPAGASAATRAKSCSPKGAKVVARSGTSLLLTRSHGDDDLYGPGTRVTTCRKGHRPVVLVDTGPGDSVSISHGVFTTGYVAFARSSLSTACTKYLGDDPQCHSTGVASYNRRTGRLRASGSGQADVLVVTPAGWLAWLSPADGSGARTLQAVDSHGARVLASGAIDPASVRAAGSTVSWTVGDVAGAATLS
jgi:hypothetical protein